MKVYMYKNLCCQPENKTGMIKHVANSAEADAFINMFIIMMKTQEVLKKYSLKFFIANDEVPQGEIDHYVLFGEHLSREFATKFEEVDIKERAKTLHAGYQVYLKRHAANRAAADARIKSLLAQGATIDELRQVFYGAN